jgi:hypothetical protein
MRADVVGETRVPARLLSEVLWRRRDEPSLEICRVTELPDGYALQGNVLTAVDSRPFQVQYVVWCDRRWVTGGVHVHAIQGESHRQLQLRRDGEGRWWRDDAHIAELDGLIDVDLSITPSTNTLPIRRLDLTVGAVATTTAAWIRFPDLSVQRLDQQYTRVSATRYLYESRGGSFRADLDVDDQGVVIDYGNLWERVTS